MDLKQFKGDYLSLYQKLYRVAYYILESESDAEDALQELYLRLWKGRDFLDNVLNPQAYSIRLLKNICIDRIRSASKMALDAAIPEEETVAAEDERIDSRQRLEKVLAAVKSLPERQRQVLTMRLIEEKPYDKISSETGLNYLTVRVTLARARKSLKSKLKQEK